jgi:hypothetical protein
MTYEEATSRKIWRTANREARSAVRRGESMDLIAGIAFDAARDLVGGFWLRCTSVEYADCWRAAHQAAANAQGEF